MDKKSDNCRFVTMSMYYIDSVLLDSANTLKQLKSYGIIFVDYEG